MRLHAAALLGALLVSQARAQERDVDYVVVVPTILRDAVEPLVRHRTAEGLRVRVLELKDESAKEPLTDTGEGKTPSFDEKVRTQISEDIAVLRPRFLLLAGDVEWIPSFDVAEAATDRPYGDFDGDGLPEVSIGRFPAGDPATLERMVARTIAYEAARATGAWQKQCALVAGEGRFGAQVDAIIEDMFQRIVSQKIPAQFDVDLTYANPRSPFCYPFERFAERVVQRTNEGALVVAYVGHGDVDSVDRLTAPGPNGRTVAYPVLDMTHVPRLDGASPPIMLAIACWTGRYEGPTPCIGEALLATGKGPVAFFGSSRISHPIPNALLGISLVETLFEEVPTTNHDDRLGPRLDRARRTLVKVEKEDPLRTQVMMMAAAFVPPEELEAELPRHVDMYNLLGDPALRLARPTVMPVEARVDGQRIQVTGTAPAGARGVTVTLEVTRERTARAAAAGESVLERYARSNEKVVATALEIASPDGTFKVTLPIPAGSAPGKYVVKVFGQGETACAAGAAPITLGASAMPAIAAPPAPVPARRFH